MKFMLRLLGLFLMLVGLVLAFIPTHANKCVRVVVMLGQSNAVGHATLPTSPQPVYRHISERVWCYNRSGRLVPAKEPLDDGRGGWGTKLGLHIAYGNDDHVLLVPAAVNGSAIEEWLPAGAHLDSAVMRVEDAMRAASELGRPEVYAIIWDQGESDMKSAERADAWGSRFRCLTDRLQAKWPDARYLWVVTAEPQGEPAKSLLWWREVQWEQMTMRVRNGSCVDATGLPMEPDGVHRTWHAQQVMAQRFHEVLKTLQ